MAEDIKYTVKEIEDLAQQAEKLKGVFGEDYKKIFTDINTLLDGWRQSFGKGNDEVKEMLRSSLQLRQKHEEMVDLAIKFQNQLHKVADMEKWFQDRHGVSIKRARELIELSERRIKLDNYRNILLGEEKRLLDDIANSNDDSQIETKQRRLGDLQKELASYQDRITSIGVQLGEAGYINEHAMGLLRSDMAGIDYTITNLEDYAAALQNATDNTKELAEATSKWNKENKEIASKIVSGGKAVWGVFKQLGTEVVNKYVEIDHKVISFGRTVGLSTQAIKSQKASILEHYDEMAARLGMTFEEIFKFQEQYTRNTGRAVILTNQQVESLAEMSKLTSAESVEKMTSSMDEFGASTETATDYLALNMARARAQGLDAAKASEAFANNIKMASRYSFQEGINGVSKMTLLSQRLKFNMESISSSLDKFSTIEGAIETSANIQMLGGSYAMNFSNPLDAMGEALMDAEGFINRIVNTVSSQATFNRQTGMVEMSGFEKARLREFSKQMGLNYDDTWNMVAQQTKIQAMSRELGQGKWSETEEALIANKAQFNAEKNRWEIALPGHDTPTAITDLTSSMLEELKDVAALSDEDLKGDVRHIRQDLRRFIDKTIESDKSIQESWKGAKENLMIDGAHMAASIDNRFQISEDIKNYTNQGNGEFLALMPSIINLTSAAVATYGSKKALELVTKGVKRVRKGKLPTSGGASTPKPKTDIDELIEVAEARAKNKGVASHAAKLKKIKRVRALKGGAKTGGAIGAAMLAIEGAQSWYNFRQNKEAIENSNLSQEQKNAALEDAKQERNKGYAQAAGGAIGSVIGGALLSWIPVVGTALGATLGGMAGSAIGGMVAGGKDKSSATSMTTIENTEIQNATEQLALLTSIDTSVGDIVKNRSQLTERVLAMSSVRTNDNHIVNKSQIGGTTTYFNQNGESVTTHNSNLKHDLNVSGTIKLQGEKGEQASIDVKKLLENNQFVTSVTDMIVAQLNMRSGQGGRVNKDTTQYRLGGAQSPENQNLTTTSLA